MSLSVVRSLRRTILGYVMVQRHLPLCLVTSFNVNVNLALRQSLQGHLEVKDILEQIHLVHSKTSFSPKLLITL